MICECCAQRIEQSTFGLTERVMRDVCWRHGVTRDDLEARKKGQRFVRARHDFWFRLVILHGKSLPQAAFCLGKDHTTVLSGVRRFSHIEYGTERDASLDEIRATVIGMHKAKLEIVEEAA
jgi:chromosomal replication initiation ATPase DnaA